MPCDAEWRDYGRNGTFASADPPWLADSDYHCHLHSPLPNKAMTASTAVLHATTLGGSITCKDVDASIRWYRDIVGFAVVQTYEHEGKLVGASIAAGDIHLVLNQDNGQLGWDRIKGQGLSLQLGVATPADVDAAAARIKAAGGTLLSEPSDRPWGARMFQVKDPDGFKLGVSTPLKG